MTIKPHSGPLALAKMDMRSAEGVLMRRERAALRAHVGGDPTATQLRLIESAVQLRLRIAVMDRTFAEKDNVQTHHDNRSYLAFMGRYERTLRALGIDPKPKPAKTLTDVLREAAGG